MLKIYGSPDCPDCRNACNNFDKFNIKYEYYDIRELKNLKQFLIYRDTLDEVFLRLKKIHDIGIPAIVDEDRKVFTDWEGYLIKKGFSDIVYEGQGCSLDHKNC